MSDTPFELPPLPSPDEHNAAMMRMLHEAEQARARATQRLHFLGFTAPYPLRDQVATTCRVCGVCVVLYGAHVEPAPGIGNTQETGWAEVHRGRCEP